MTTTSRWLAGCVGLLLVCAGAGSAAAEPSATPSSTASSGVASSTASSTAKSAASASPARPVRQVPNRPRSADTSGRPRARATTFVGSLGSCNTTKGALVAVDFAHWSGPAVRGCDPSPTTGIKLLTTAGFTTAGDQHDGPQFICRIGHPLFNSGTQYPTKAQDPCVVTPPASAYWSYWLAAKGSNTWTYSQYGAYSDKPTNGEVEAWTFGATDVAGTTGQPAFTPNQARAGLPTGTKSVARNAKARTAANRPLDTGATAPDTAEAADYLVRNLVDGTHYEPFGGPDYGLTIDGALALAATGTRDAALGKITDYIATNQNDYTFLSGQYKDYVGGGYVGKVALLAEATGHDPRDFGGVDLIHALDGLTCTAAQVKAKLTGCTLAGNYRGNGSVFGLTLAMIAQLRAGDAKGATTAIAYLEGLQHSSGAFPSVLPGEDSETDSTGMAAMTLALVPGAKARTALAKALSWLAGQQESTGGFPGASGDSVNSAAIVIQALRLDAQTYATQIAKAETFLAGQQNSDGGFNVADGTPGSDVRASTQALGGAVGTPFGSVLDNLTAKNNAASGADYLVTQLTDGTHYESGGYVDYGGTADGIFGLLGAGGHDADVTKMVAYLAGNVDAYADTSATYGGPYSGSLAKLALVAEATHANPHAFGSTNLLSLIESKVCTAAIAPDQYGSTPCTAAGDVYNAFSTVSQSLAVLALQASSDSADHLTIDSPIVQRLHQLQCPDGGFSSVLITSGQKCTSDVDTTGFAVQALATVQGTDTWLGAAQAYLQKAQLASGLYDGAVKSSSNSTALAAGALQSLVGALTSPTADPPQPKTVTPIVALQQSLTGLNTTSVAGGGFVTDPTATDADVRASTQAVLASAQQTLLGLSGAPVLSLPRAADATAPGGGSSTSPTSSSTPTGTSSASAGSNSSSSSNSGGVTSTQSSSGLASTGLDALQLLIWAAALIALGAGLTIGGRRGVWVRRLARHR